MELSNYEMNLPCYSIGDDIYKSVPAVCEKYGTRVLLIGGVRALAAAKSSILACLANSKLTLLDTHSFIGDCTYAQVDALRALPAYQDCDMVFAIGGGKCIDSCKNLCIPDGKPLFTFPTIASNCAACTSVSIMYNEDGTFLKPHFYTQPPTVVSPMPSSMH